MLCGACPYGFLADHGFPCGRAVLSCRDEKVAPLAMPQRCVISECRGSNFAQGAHIVSVTAVWENRTDTSCGDAVWCRFAPLCVHRFRIDETVFIITPVLSDGRRRKWFRSSRTSSKTREPTSPMRRTGACESLPTHPEEVHWLLLLGGVRRRPLGHPSVRDGIPPRRAHHPVPDHQDGQEPHRIRREPPRPRVGSPREAATGQR